MFHAAIAGTGRAVPGKVLTNADLEKLVKTSDEWILTRTGIRERHVAADGETLSDFCVAAGTLALEAAGVAAKDLDAILVATVTPDQPIPAVACLVQQKLGAKKAAAWDQNAGCSGWLYGLHVADGLIQSGKARNVLLVGAEFLTRFTDYTEGGVTVTKPDTSKNGRWFSVFASGPTGPINSATCSSGRVPTSRSVRRTPSTIRRDQPGGCPTTLR